jgi:selenide,water dikinase
MAQVLRGLPTFDDPNLLVGPASFDDAGVYRLGEGLAVVQTVDFFPPLVDDPYTFGRIAAANSLSDVYAMGGEPRTAMNIVGFPDDKLPLEVLVEILRGGAERVAAAGAVIVGGHSVRDVEIKYGLAVTGIVDPAQMVTNAGAKPGDRLVLTKPLGTGFVTTAFKANRCPADTLQTAAESMMALNAAAARVMRDAGIRGGTDITGFGLAGHANELAEASGVAIVLEIGKLPLLPGSEPLAEAGFFTRASKTNRDFVEPVLRREGSLDSIREEYLYDAQTSGGLLMSVPEESVNDVLARLHREGVAAACVIGSVAERTNANLVIRP